MQCGGVSSLTTEGDGSYVEFTLADPIELSNFMTLRLTFQTR